MRFLEFALAALTALPAISASPLLDPDYTPVEGDILPTAAEISEITDTQVQTFGNTVGSTCGCILMSIFLLGKVHFPGSDKYEKESTAFWSATAWQDPRCVFVPASAKDVAKGVQIMKTCKSEFAVRGGGHMPVPKFANTESGVLFALSGLNTLSLDSTKTKLTLGPSHRWGDVYRFLQSYDRYAIGGRLSTVGVPGLILGGGINFFTNKYGFAMDNVISYEVVLASGAIVEATATNAHQDLFYALHGGSSNFGIVTKFVIKTHPIPKVWAGLGTFIGEENFDAFYSALTSFANSGYKTKGAGAIPQINFQPTPGMPGGGLAIGAQVLVHEGDEADPAIFNDFKNVQLLQSDFGVNVPVNVSDTLSMEVPGNRHVFRVQSSLATLSAAKLVHSIFFSMTPRLAAEVPSLTSAGIALQPIPATALAFGHGKTTFSGIDPTQNYYWYAISANWNDAADDAKMDAWIKEVGQKMRQAFVDNNLIGNGGREFYYLNDAQGGQDVFVGYGETELAKMRTIRQKYDKDGKVFGKNGLCKGGFKL